MEFGIHYQLILIIIISKITYANLNLKTFYPLPSKPDIFHYKKEMLT